MAYGLLAFVRYREHLLALPACMVWLCAAGPLPNGGFLAHFAHCNEVGGEGVVTILARAVTRNA